MKEKELFLLADKVSIQNQSCSSCDGGEAQVTFDVYVKYDPETESVESASAKVGDEEATVEEGEETGPDPSGLMTKIFNGSATVSCPETYSITATAYIQTTLPIDATAKEVICN